MRSVLLVLLVAVVATGCWWGKQPLVPPEKLWREGNEAMEDEAYELAITAYKSLLDQHPFDPNAEKAELKIAEAYYLAGRYPEAIAAFGDFERMHPTSSHLPRTEYYRGMASLAQYRSSDRETEVVSHAQTSFRNVADRFPGSPWAARARLRTQECREILAEHDGGVAAFYLRRGQHHLDDPPEELEG